MRISIIFCRSVSLCLAILLVNPAAAKPKKKTERPQILLQVDLIPGHRREQHEVFGKNYVITSSGEGSSTAAERMFAQGGNIIDAACALSFALAVERPHSTGIGGGGFLLYFNPKIMTEPLAFDFREMAPLKASERMYLDEKGAVRRGKSLDGILSVAVPGFVAGVLEVHEKYGKLPRAKILEPAIEMARQGFKIYQHLAYHIIERAEVLKDSPSAKALFFDASGKPLKEGDLLVQQDLAKTLERIAAKGKDGFYDGWVAEAILDESKRLGGILSEKDFENYQVKQRKPVSTTFEGHTVYSMPPPSSGGVHVLEMLNILEILSLEPRKVHSAENMHEVIASMQRVFADRAKFLGDTDFVKVPVKQLVSKEYARKIAQEILAQKDKAISSEEVLGGDIGPEAAETTHFSLMDGDGNMVASTQSVNWYFGSGVVVPGTGIILNDHMDDFAVSLAASNVFGVIGGKNNLITPGKRPLSSMSPTLVTKDNKAVMALGTPSGPRIITCVAQTLLNYLFFKLPLYESLGALRYHHQWKPDEVWIEPGPMDPMVRRKLDKMGYRFKTKSLDCKVNAVALENGVLHGVADQRSEGLALAR